MHVRSCSRPRPSRHLTRSPVRPYFESRSTERLRHASGRGAGCNARVVSTSFSTKISMVEADRPQESCAVELRVQLPKALAAEVEEVQREDPEVLSRILVYGLTRRTIYRRLWSRDRERM